MTLTKSSQISDFLWRPNLIKFTTFWKRRAQHSYRFDPCQRSCDSWLWFTCFFYSSGGFLASISCRWSMIRCSRCCGKLFAGLSKIQWNEEAKDKPKTAPFQATFGPALASICCYISVLNGSKFMFDAALSLERCSSRNSAPASTKVIPYSVCHGSSWNLFNFAVRVDDNWKLILCHVFICVIWLYICSSPGPPFPPSSPHPQPPCRHREWGGSM